MFKLQFGYLVTGIATGFILLFSFIWSLPDGKLHLVFCNVGQGDAAYVRFPDGRDLVVDGGPDDKILGCLGRHMPFWDRKIDLVLLTHPQKDHLQGLISVIKRYQVEHFVRSEVENNTEGYTQLIQALIQKKVSVRLVTRGEKIAIGTTTLSIIWPSEAQITRKDGELNDYSVVFLLRHRSFDALFTGDADRHVEGNYVGDQLADDNLELLKVPHHGSKAGMTEEFVRWLHPKLSVISVGKNNYGHPSSEALELLSLVGSRVLRTDQVGDVEVVSDGKNWIVRTGGGHSD